MDKASKDHKGKVGEVKDQGLDSLGEILTHKMDGMMEHAEQQLEGIRPTEEEHEKNVEEMAEYLFEKCMNLPDEKKTKDCRENNEDANISDEEHFPKQAPAESERDAGREEPTQEFHTDEAKEADTETQHLEEEESTAEQKHDSIEIESSDKEEDADDDKWAKQGTIEDTTMVAVDLSTSSDTSTKSPTLTTLTSKTSKIPTEKMNESCCEIDILERMI